jgi:methionine sulfoxide reductase catalytic subunit
MLIKKRALIRESEITDPAVFAQRRQIIKAMLAGGAIAGGWLPFSDAEAQQRWPDLPKGPLGNTPLTPTEAERVKSYTNYYEFTYNKDDAAVLAQQLDVDPWAVSIGGAVERPLTLSLDDILKQPLEERIYRFRCVEAWSMVVPWVGFPLANLLKQAKPLSSARYVRFETLLRPQQMPNQQRGNSTLQWPYREGLRIDEAMHPLTLLAVGMYGDTLPKQNGAPLRLVVPWKYGFKSIKAIVKIELTSSMPDTSWALSAPDEYGFYANVNPGVAHPRWSQSSERVLGSGFFTPRRATELFNGYGEQVAALYNGMDLKQYF